ncbi:MAG TPA: lysylphosphatidylglycerol synthase transmembrane domain-containing protein [bacterium]|nr:lysylphosphatidylglycerol synthase transmembrane domain-containing protein [bacterium]
MIHPSRKALFVVFFSLVGVMILALIAGFFTDGPKLLAVVHSLKTPSILLALGFMGLAYFALCMSFHSLFAITHYPIPVPRLFIITFISATFNYIISSGGMSTMAVRSYLLKQQKVPYSVSIPLSFAQNTIFNVVLSFVCLGGLLYLQTHHEFNGGPIQAMVWSFMAGLVGVVAVMVLVFFNKGFRRVALRALIQMGTWVSRRVFKKSLSPLRLWATRRKVEGAVKYLHQGWGRLAQVFFWVSMDWFFTSLTLFFCFQAAGLDLTFGLLLVAFAVMFLTSTANLVPAGLGVSEGSLVGVCSALGMDVNHTLVAALLFRVIFFFIPLAISTGLYLDTMRTLWKNQAQA